MRVLGRTGLYVSAIGLGAGQFGKFGGTTEHDCIRVAHCAFDGGVTLIDTSDLYSFGESETIVGKAIAGRRDKTVVTSKCGAPVSGNLMERGGSRRWINQAIDRSLKRLNTDYIDLYQLHQPDPFTDLCETLDAFTDLIRTGKIRYFGLSNFAADALAEAHARAETRSFLAPYSEQAPYSIFDRRVEADVLPVCQRFGAGFLAYSPLDQGLLSGKYRKGVATEASVRQRLQPLVFDFNLPYNQAKLDAIEKLVPIAADLNIDLSHMAVAFVLSHLGVTSALVGTGKVSYMEKFLAGQDVWLSDETLDRIDAIVAPGVSLDPTVRSLSLHMLADSSLRRRKAPEKGPPKTGMDALQGV